MNKNSPLVRINPYLKKDIDKTFPTDKRKFKSFSDKVETLYENYIEIDKINRSLTKANNLLWGKKITKNVWKR